MRLAVLYARSRGVPVAALLSLAFCVTGAWVGHRLNTSPTLDPITATVPVAVALAVCLAVVLAGTLHSPADEIERTTPRLWAGWRASHAAVAAAAATGLTAPVLPAVTYGQGALLRNTAGLLGLGLLAATTIGPRLSWVLPLGYATTIYLSAPLNANGAKAAWAFLMQPASNATALTCALLLLAAGTAAWTSRSRSRMP